MNDRDVLIIVNSFWVVIKITIICWFNIVYYKVYVNPSKRKHTLEKQMGLFINIWWYSNFFQRIKFHWFDKHFHYISWQLLQVLQKDSLRWRKIYRISYTNITLRMILLRRCLHFQKAFSFSNPSGKLLF